LIRRIGTTGELVPVICTFGIVFQAARAHLERAGHRVFKMPPPFARREIVAAKMARLADMITQDEANSDLATTVKGDSITVAKFGTGFFVTYEQRPENPHLILIRSWAPLSDTTPAAAEFRARAFQAAVAKARELGWII
jgi:hypothetical protein